MSNLKNILSEIEKLNDDDLWAIFADSKKSLKKRGLVRTNNITGERGEFLAIEIYNKTSGLPKLQAAPEGTQNVDALSRNGERYSIKTITAPNHLTGVFYGLGNPEDKELPDRKFEFVIIVIIDEDLQLLKMLEVDWSKFLKLRKYHKTMRAWNLNVTQELLKDCKIIFEVK